MNFTIGNTTTQFGKTMLVSQCETQCRQQILSYHFNTNFLPLFAVWICAIIYFTILSKKEFLRGLYIANGYDPKLFDAMMTMFEGMMILFPAIYFVWYWLHFVKGWI